MVESKIGLVAGSIAKSLVDAPIVKRKGKVVRIIVIKIGATVSESRHATMTTKKSADLHLGKADKP